MPSHNPVSPIPTFIFPVFCMKSMILTCDKYNDENENQLIYIQCFHNYNEYPFKYLYFTKTHIILGVL